MQCIQNHIVWILSAFGASQHLYDIVDVIYQQSIAPKVCFYWLLFLQDQVHHALPVTITCSSLSYGRRCNAEYICH